MSTASWGFLAFSYFNYAQPSRLAQIKKRISRSFRTTRTANTYYPAPFEVDQITPLVSAVELTIGSRIVSTNREYLSSFFLAVYDVFVSNSHIQYTAEANAYDDPKGVEGAGKRFLIGI